MEWLEMNVPLALALNNHLKRIDKIDEAVCECIKILLDRIETLETKVELMEAKINDIQKSDDK
tara:strand:- start:633 stop:821 length:189 start_codon:yes stop_codon:yes gene_type:complete